MNFNERLKYCRIKKGLTQDNLSKMLGIKRPTYAKYETGENMLDYKTLLHLADLFSVSTDYLLGRITDESTPEYNAELSLFFLFKDYLKDLGIDIKDLFDMQKWNRLNYEDVKMIMIFIDWMSYRTTERDSKK